MHTSTSSASSLVAAPIALRNVKRINLLEFLSHICSLKVCSRSVCQVNKLSLNISFEVLKV